jgi:folylpolyglutamate synthase/dihydropteroate synthase
VREDGLRTGEEVGGEVRNVVLVTGSLHLVGGVLEVLESTGSVVTGLGP